MKKFKSFICVLLAFLMVASSSLTSLAYTKQQGTNNTGSAVEVYNGMGEYVGDFESIQEFEREFSIENNQKGPVAWLLSAAAAYGVVSMINDFSYLLTGVDIKVWVRNEVIVPYYNSRKNMKLYSRSGSTNNPYPPNSYQYHEYKRSNYYWVVQ